jgi:hypothetical protein
MLASTPTYFVTAAYYAPKMSVTLAPWMGMCVTGDGYYLQ